MDFNIFYITINVILHLYKKDNVIITVIITDRLIKWVRI